MQLALTAIIVGQTAAYIAQPAVMGTNVIPPAIKDQRVKADAEYKRNHGCVQCSE